MMTFTHVQTPRGRFGTRLHGEQGKLVVCVHGFPDDATTYDHLADALVAAGYRVAAVNLRGYFPSPLHGSLEPGDLVKDLLAVVDALSPNAPVALIGHDYGAQLAYRALARAPQRFGRAILMSGAHPAFVKRNARRSLRQVWMSRYIIFFQLGRYADRRVARRDFAYIERLWRRWSPGFIMPAEHRRHVKDTLRMSMPAPVAMYRAGGFTVAPDEITVPTLYITGNHDGCAQPNLAKGQDTIFTSSYVAQDWDRVGHYPHLEQPHRTATTVIDWLNDEDHAP
jgi:pimeloyl-ACP methyl ester carboxylesterase